MPYSSFLTAPQSILPFNYMYVCMYVCMNACMHVRTYVCLNVCVYNR